LANSRREENEPKELKEPSLNLRGRKAIQMAPLMMKMKEEGHFGLKGGVT